MRETETEKRERTKERGNINKWIVDIKHQSGRQTVSSSYTKLLDESTRDETSTTLVCGATPFFLATSMLEKFDAVF